MEEHGAHVGLEVERGAVESERDDARSRGGPDTGELHELVGGFGKPSAELGRADVGAALERERTSVVAEPLPLLEHVGGARRGERVDRREEREEARPVVEHALDLGLL